MLVFPAGHNVHMAAPADAENDPGSHFAHDAEPTEIEAGASEYVPAAQSAQVFHVAAVNEVNTPARTHR